MSNSPTTVAKTITLNLDPSGMVNVTGSLVTVRNTEKEASFRQLCPECLPGGVGVRQQYTCEHGHGPFLPAEITAKGKQVGDALIPLTPEELVAVSGLAASDSTVTMRFHPAAEVAHLNRRTGTVYAFVPGPGKNELIGVLRDLIADGEVAFFVELTVKRVHRLFRIESAAHGLDLVEMARPEAVFSFDARDYPYAPRSLDLAMQLITAYVEPFDAEAYKDRAGERLAAIIAAKDGTEATVTALPAPAPAANDLEAALAASLAAAAARKAAA